MSAFDALITRAQQNPARVVLPEATDSRVLEAALYAQRDGRCHPVLVGEKKAIELAAKELALPCLLYTSPSPRDGLLSRMPSSA